MKVILQQDVKDVGKVGDLVNVKTGFARNFLFPQKFAVEASEAKVKEFEHLKRVADAKRKKAMADRQTVLAKLNGLSLNFKVSAGESEKLFGSITTSDISKQLEIKGHSVDRRDIHLEDQIKVLGNHKATIKFGEGLETTIQIVVERA